MKAQRKLMLGLLIISNPLFAICQNQVWTIKDRAALVGYLANPGFSLGFNKGNKSKILAWNFYFEKPYYNISEADIKKKQTSFFNLVYRYVLRKENLHLFDTLSINNYTLDSALINSSIAGIDGDPNLDQTFLNSLGNIRKILVFPCEIGYGSDSISGKYLMIYLNKEKCPKTSETVSMDDYAFFLSLLIKEYALKGISGYKMSHVIFVNSKNQIQYYKSFNFKDELFSRILKYHLFHKDSRPRMHTNQ